jgi:hypothetical protein
MFWGSLMSSSFSTTPKSLKLKTLHCLNTSGSNYPLIVLHLRRMKSSATALQSWKKNYGTVSLTQKLCLTKNFKNY